MSSIAGQSSWETNVKVASKRGREEAHIYKGKKEDKAGTMTNKGDNKGD